MAYGLRAITFNGYDMQTTDVVSLRFPDIDDVNYGENNFARLGTTDGQKWIETKYGGRVITVQGMITGTSIANVEGVLDTFKENIFLNEIANLDIGYAGTTRRWKAKVRNVRMDESLKGLTRGFTVEFETLGFGQETTATTVSYANETGSPTKTITFGGSVKPLPKYIITVNSATSLTGVTILCDTTNREIEVQETLVATDVLEIDTELKTVTINSVAVDQFLGIFPEVNQGENDITFTFASSAHDVDIDIQYTKRYL